MRMGHKTISVRAVPNCSLQDNAFFVCNFFQEPFVLSSPTEFGSLCVLLSIKCKIHSTLGLKQVSKNSLAYFSLMKAFPKKVKNFYD